MAVQPIDNNLGIANGMQSARRCVIKVETWAWVTLAIIIIFLLLVRQVAANDFLLVLNSFSLAIQVFECLVYEVCFLDLPRLRAHVQNFLAPVEAVDLAEKSHPIG